MSRAVRSAPLLSKCDAGTHELTIAYTSMGQYLLELSMKRMPSAPITLAISCGSVTTAVVPWAATTLANSGTASIDDSICTCPSMKPGQTNCPPRSSVSRPPYVPMPAMRPSAMATSPSWISQESTLTICPPRSTRSAGVRPAATSIRCFRCMASPSVDANDAWSFAKGDGCRVFPCSHDRALTIASLLRRFRFLPRTSDTAAGPCHPPSGIARSPVSYPTGDTLCQKNTGDSQSRAGVLRCAASC
jgi:hypothetical protein